MGMMFASRFEGKDHFGGSIGDGIVIRVLKPQQTRITDAVQVVSVNKHSLRSGFGASIIFSKAIGPSILVVIKKYANISRP